MRTDAPLLTLVQWLSPAYPLGSFSYSHGLEAAIAAGWVSDAAELEEWLSDLMRFGTGRADAIALRLAYCAPDREAALELNRALRAFPCARERILEAERQGRAFAEVTAKVWDIDVPDTLFPVAAGYAAARVGLDLEALVPVWLHAFCGNLVSGAQRLMALGQTEAQQVLSRLQPVCAQVVADTRQAGFADIQSTTFLWDVAAMNHETLEPRLFQT
jgi:urease accessory protein